MNSIANNDRASRAISPWAIFGIGIISIGVTTWLALMAAANPNPILIGLALAPIGALVVYLRPHFATFLCVFLIYSNIPVVAAQFHGAPYAAAAAVPGLLLLPITFLLVRDGQGLLVPWEVVCALGLVVVQCAGVILSRDPAYSFGILARILAEGFALFLFIVNAVRTPEIVRGCLVAMLAAGALAGMITGHQYLTGNYQSNYGGFAQSDQNGFDQVNSRGVTVVRARSAGPVGEKNRFAQNMLMLFPIGLCLVAAEKRRLLQLFFLGMTLLSAVGWAVAFSRGSVVGLAGVLVVATFFGYVRTRVLVWIGLAGVILILLMPAYRERVVSIVSTSELLGGRRTVSKADSSLQGRATIMLAAARVMAENPILGVGPGMFPFYAAEYGKANGYKALEGNWQAHNLYLGIGADHGVIGLGFFMATILMVMYKLHCIRLASRDRRPEAFYLATGLNLALLLYLATGMFLHLSYVRYYWLIVGISAGAAYALRPDHSPDYKTGQLEESANETPSLAPRKPR